MYHYYTPHYHILLDPFIRLQYVPVFASLILLMVHQLLAHGLQIYALRYPFEYQTILPYTASTSGGRNLGNQSIRGESDAVATGAGIGITGMPSETNGNVVGVTESTSLLQSDFPNVAVQADQEVDMLKDGNVFESMQAATLRVRNSTKHANTLFWILFFLVALITFSVWFQKPPPGYLYKTTRVLSIILLQWFLFGISLLWWVLDLTLYHGDDVMRMRVTTGLLISGISLVMLILAWMEMVYRFRFETQV